MQPKPTLLERLDRIEHRMENLEIRLQRIEVLITKMDSNQDSMHDRINLWWIICAVSIIVLVLINSGVI